MKPVLIAIILSLLAFGSISAEDLPQGINIDNEAISLDLKGVDIVELFRILSLKMGLTIVPSKSVTGRINVFLNNLTFQDALDVILISQDLACEREENIINIMTAAEYEKLYGKKYNEKRKSRTLKLNYAKPATIFNALGQIKSDIGKIIVDETSGTILLIDIPEKLELMEGLIKDLDRPLETEIFDLKYAKPADIKTHLTDALTTGPGEIFVDERSNKVIVSDLPEKMKKIERMVSALDEAPQQVFIEAEILQITLKEEYQRGIDWDKVFSRTPNFTGTFPSSPSFTPSPELASTDLFQIAVGTLVPDKYSATLQLLKTFGDTKILSRPRIAAINNQEAKIMVGSREAYVSQTLSQAESTTVTSESVEFIDVGVKLNVVPSINKDGFVTLKIKPEVSSVRETLTTALESTIPIVETSEAETVVKVKDGTMIMIAGLMKEDKRRDTTGIPLVCRIPLLGALFGSRATLDKKTELIVFLTPHIITGEATVSGTELEKTFPPDILPEDLKEDIISKKVDEIKPEPEGEMLPALDEAGRLDIQKKMKRIKEY